MKRIGVALLFGVCAGLMARGIASVVTDGLWVWQWR